MWFWIDLVASFPFEVLLPSAEEDPVEFVAELVNSTSASSGGGSGGAWIMCGVGGVGATSRVVYVAWEASGQSVVFMFVL